MPSVQTRSTLHYIQSGPIQRAGGPVDLSERLLVLRTRSSVSNAPATTSGILVIGILRAHNSRRGTNNDSDGDSRRARVSFAATDWRLEGDLLGPELTRMKQLCNAPQPDHPTHHCVRFQQHSGPHQTFVAEWKDGDLNSRRRPALPFRAGNQTGKRQPAVQHTRRPWANSSSGRRPAARAR